MCFKIDANKKSLHCRFAAGTNLDGNGDFTLDYEHSWSAGALLLFLR